jgi:outer membrane protein TolC
MQRRARPAVGTGLLLLCVLAAPTAPAEEQSATAPQAPPAPAATPPPALAGELPLSLPEATALAIENNLDVEIARYDPRIAEEEATAAWGAYDPVAFAQFGYFDAERPQANSFEGVRIVTEKGFSSCAQRLAGQACEGLDGAGVEGIVPMLGWGYRISYTGSGIETESAIQSLSPEYRTGLRGTITLPLLRDFLWGQPWYQVKTTGIFEGRALEVFRQALMDTVQQVENAYFGLVAAEERLRVANKSLEASLTLLDQQKAQYEVGVVSRVEVVQAEAGVAEREVNRIREENFYRAAQDRLIDLVLGPNLTPDSTLEIRPTTIPDVVQYDVDPEAATAKAFENRPELAVARADIETGVVSLKFARNQRLPAFDAVGTYGYNGLAGRTNPAPDIFGNPRAPIPIKGHYHDADDDFFKADGARTWGAGAIFSVPLGNTTARADVRRAELELRKARAGERRLEQSIILDVRNAIRNLRSAQEGIEAAERARVAAEEQLRAETIRLEHGESTPYDVLLREEDLVEAESQKITALQVYRDSIVALDRAQGTILVDRNVVVEDARQLR